MRRRVLYKPVGSSVRLKCQATGTPPPVFTWWKDQTPLPPPRQGKRPQWTLTLKNLQPQDSAKYTCHVSNPAGHINATYKLDVIGNTTDTTTNIFSFSSITLQFNLYPDLPYVAKLIVLLSL